MGSRADYLRSLGQQRQQRNLQGNVIINPSELDPNAMQQMDNMDTPQAKPTNNKDPWTTWTRTADTISGTSLRANAFSGTMEAVDSVVDTAIVVGGGIAGFFSGLWTLMTEGDFNKGWDNVQSGVQSATNYDWTSHVEGTLNQLDPVNIFNGRIGKKEYWEDWGNIYKSDEQARNVVQKYQKSAWTQDLDVVGQVEQGIGQILPSVALGSGLANAEAPMVMQAGVQAGFQGSQAFGRSFEEATSEGANYNGALGYASLKGGIEGVYNGLTYALGANIAAKSGTGVVGKLTNSVGSKIAQASGNQKLGNIVGKALSIAIDSGQEALEEATETFTDPLLKQITYDTDAINKAYGDDEKVKQTVSSASTAAGIAFLTSAIVGTVREAGDSIQNKKVAEDLKNSGNEIAQKVNDISQDLQYGKITKKQAKIEIEKLNLQANKIAENASKILESTKNNVDYNIKTDTDINTKTDIDTNIKTNTNIDTKVDTNTKTDVDIDNNVKSADLKTETKATTITKEETDYVNFINKNLPKELVRDSANLRQDKYYEPQTARDLYDRIEHKIVRNFKSKDGDYEFQIDNKSQVLNKDFNTLNLVQDKAQVRDIIYKDISNSTIKHGNEEIEFEALPNSIKKQVRETIDNIILYRGTKTDKVKYEQHIAKLQESIKKAISKKWKQMRALSRTIKTTRIINNKFEKNKQITLGGDIEIPELNIFKNAVKAVDPSRRVEGVSPKSVGKFFTEFTNYTSEKMAQSGLPFSQELRQTIDLIGESLTDGKYPNAHVSMETHDLINHALGLINDQLNAIKSERTQQNINTAREFNEQVQVLNDIYGGKKIGGNFIDNIMDTTMNIPNYLAKYLGEHNALTQHFSTDYINVMGKRENARAKQRKVFLEDIPKELGISQNELNSKLRQNTDILGHKVKQSELLDLYCHSMASPEIYDVGFKIYDEKAKKVVVLNLNKKEFKQEIIDKIPSVLRKFSKKLLAKYYNGSAKKYISEAYKRKHNGLEMELVDFYYPTKRFGENNLGLENGDIGASGVITENIAPIHKRIKNKNPFEIMPLEARFDSYCNNITRYGEMGDWIEKTRIMLNTKVGDHNANYYLQQILPNFDGKKGWNSYITKVILERPIGEELGTLGKTIEKVYSNSVSSILGANPGTILRQFLSLPQLLNANDVTVKNFTKAVLTGGKNLLNLKETTAEIEEFAPYFIKRFGSYESTRSNVNANTLNKIGQVFAKGMEFTDKSVIVTVGWDLALNTASEALNLPKNNIQVKKLAGDYLTMATLQTQSNSDPMFTSRLRSGDLGRTLKYTVGMFGSDSQNLLQELNHVSFEYGYSIKRQRWLKKQLSDQDISEYKANAYKKQLELESKTYSPKNEVKAVSKYVTSLGLTALGAAAIAELIDRFKGKKDWEDELNANEFGKEIFMEGFVNWIPYVGTIANAIQNNSDLTVFTVDRFNKLIDVSKQTVEAIKSGDPRDIRRVVAELFFTTGDLTGIPLRNIYSTSLGFVRIGDKIAGTNYADNISNWVKAFSPQYIKSRVTSDIANNKIGKANADLSSWEFLYSIPQSKETNKVLVNLKKEGFDVLPKSNLESYKDEKGKVVQLSSKEKEQFFETYKQATKEIDTLIKEQSFTNLPSEEKSKAIKLIYDTYYDVARAKITKSQPKTRLGKFIATGKVPMKMSKLAIILNNIKKIQATKKQTRKELVMNYVNKLGGLTKGEKLLLLYLANYKISDTKGFVKYLNRIGLKKTEIKALLK